MIKRRKRGRKPKHPIKIKLRKHSTPSVDEQENPDFDASPKSESEVEPLEELENILAMKKKRVSGICFYKNVLDSFEDWGIFSPPPAIYLILLILWIFCKVCFEHRSNLLRVKINELS